MFDVLVDMVVKETQEGFMKSMTLKEDVLEYTTFLGRRGRVYRGDSLPKINEHIKYVSLIHKTPSHPKNITKYIKGELDRGNKVYLKLRDRTTFFKEETHKRWKRVQNRLSKISVKGYYDIEFWEYHHFMVVDSDGMEVETFN